ncbi:hypothetical protein HID58_091483 [Brassica napus]|uniref:NPH3 domain-containing protein n=1 Tax=Brassica napus TaxID=3708 RepID=A0ABQ7WZU7_BRANA|nr:hypothetical protein HID58_091483 [Brassica napus]
MQLMNSQKLSQEACAHVAPNKRLPPQPQLHPESPPPPTLSSTTMSYPTNRENPRLEARVAQSEMTLKELEREKDFEIKSCSDCSSVSTASVMLVDGGQDKIDIFLLCYTFQITVYSVWRERNGSLQLRWWEARDRRRQCRDGRAGGGGEEEEEEEGEQGEERGRRREMRREDEEEDD